MAAEQPLPDSQPVIEANQADQRNGASPAANNAKEPAQAAAPIGVNSAPQSTSSGKSATDPEYYVREDLEAQRAMAASTRDLDRAAWWQFALGVLGLFFLILTVIYAKRAAEETKRTADITGEIGDAQLRPYVQISRAKFQWKPGPGQPRMMENTLRRGPAGQIDGYGVVKVPKISWV